MGTNKPASLSFFHWGEDALAELKRSCQTLRRKNRTPLGQMFEAGHTCVRNSRSVAGPRSLRAKGKGRRDRPGTPGPATEGCQVLSSDVCDTSWGTSTTKRAPLGGKGRQSRQ